VFAKETAAHIFHDGNCWINGIIACMECVSFHVHVVSWIECSE